MDFDVIVVGAGPAGLSTAIRLRQLAAERSADLSVVVVEKGSEVGAHILSGAVVATNGLDRLLPDWRSDEDAPLKTPVTEDVFTQLTEKGGFRLPNRVFPSLMSNHGNFVASLANITRWLAAQAEALGVEIYPGFGAAELLFDDHGAVRGVATGDMGVDKSGAVTERFTRGMELRAKYTVLAEGARGSLSKVAIKRFGLDEGRQAQKYGIGLKELWQVQPDKHKPGRVEHSFGWPLDDSTAGGSFIYHMEDGLVSVGFVVHLDYQNPTLSPFDEFQRFKTHPMVRGLFEGAKRVSYGARAIASGGWQSVPRLSFPGGVLAGCSAGFVNVARIKGSHNAVLSGVLAAEHIYEALSAGRANDEVVAYEEAWRESDIGKDLWRVRNVKPLWSRLGTRAGVVAGGADMWSNQLFGRSPLGTMKHAKPDWASLKRLDEVTTIVYPKPDGILTFDRLSSVFVSNTNHEEDQPPHLVLKDPSIPVERNLPLYGEPARLYCPAAVFEIVYADEAAKTGPRFVINAQNCVHCKTCDIKDPSQNIDWVTPEGGGGPNYPNM